MNNNNPPAIDAAGGAAGTGPVSPGRRMLFDRLWLAGIFLLSSFFMIQAARHLSATWDEPDYLLEGARRWQNNSYQAMAKMGTMPLPLDVETLPIYLWQTWHGETYDPAHDLNRMLPWARAANLIFWALLLVYVWKSAFVLAGANKDGTSTGSWAAGFAVAFIGCEPIYLGHAGLSTTDISVTATLVAFVYHFRTSRDIGGFDDSRRWSARRLFIPGFFLALALLAKASNVVFAFVAMVALEIDLIIRAAPGRRWATLLRKIPEVSAIILIGFFLMSIYCTAFHVQDYDFALRMIKFQVQHNTIRQPISYLLGQNSASGFWYFFPLLFVMKLSIATLALFLLGMALGRRFLWNWAMIAGLAIFAFSFTYRVQLGIRMVMPAMALLFVGLAVALARGRASLAPRPRTLLTGVVSLMLLWTTVASLRAFPHDISYTNEFWGGTPNGYKVMADSNYDWGQGIPELQEWRAKNQNAPMVVWYLGTDWPLSSVGFERFRPMIQDRLVAPFLAHVRGKYVAVGATCLYGPANETATLQFLRDRQPLARTPMFFIYDFTNEPLAVPETPPSTK